MQSRAEIMRRSGEVGAVGWAGGPMGTDGRGGDVIGEVGRGENVVGAGEAD